MKKLTLIIPLVGFLALGFLGCGSDTDDPGETGYDGVYVAEEGVSGEFDFTVDDSEMDVSDSSSFLVHARDRNGLPSRNVFVGCSGEAGLTFTEAGGLTDDYGNFSGFVSCAQVGSWRMVCSAVAAGWQEYKTIKCR